MLVKCMTEGESSVRYLGLSGTHCKHHVSQHSEKPPTTVGDSVRGMSYNKVNCRGKGNYLSQVPGTAAALTQHWTKQREIGYTESWKPARQFAQHRITDTETHVFEVTAQGFSFCSNSLRLLYCELVMITQRFIFSLSLLSKYERVGQNSISVFVRPISMLNSGRSQQISCCKNKQAEMLYRRLRRKHVHPK